MSFARPHPPQTGHTRLPSLTGSETGDFPTRAALGLPPVHDHNVDDEPFSPPIGLGVSSGGQSAVQLVARARVAGGEDEKDDLSGDDDEDRDNGTIRQNARRRNGHAKTHSNGSPQKWKGKARAVEVDIENGMEVPMNVLDYTQIDNVSPTASYPPVSDEAMEERKITENLKRWEEQERQRRKAFRETRRSRAGTPSDPSLSAGSLADVTRRTSYLFRGGRRRPGTADRTSLQSSNSDAPLRPRSMATPREGGDAELGILNEPTTPSTAGSATIRTPGNPFSPQTSPTSARQSSQFGFGGKPKPKSHARPPQNMSISSAFADVRSSDEDPFSSRSSLEQQSRGNERPLPSPPPRDDDVAMRDGRWQPALTREMTSSDAPSSGDGELADGDEPRARRWWWMDWVCGCGGEEEDDEDQAGRTNPFE
ncbi:hypothetical protein CALCODRAFT_519544 [Calocera cornea HHB12733]|uniref:Uncharacterized protein n=1 Tax=Calocera cornea HHB12733 TaxID=1353952 RepID=A0A165E6R6_9BASI|nr:hypothetical protein CALCODRAFT_519544 [Calocera cornea HHB12733]